MNLEVTCLECTDLLFFGGGGKSFLIEYIRGQNQTLTELNHDETNWLQSKLFWLWNVYFLLELASRAFTQRLSWNSLNEHIFPLVYLLDKKGFHYKNKTCAKFPTIYDININNIYWQETDTSNGTFYLYGAYLDVRKNNRLGPTVRILGMINR